MQRNGLEFVVHVNINPAVNVVRIVLDVMITISFVEDLHPLPLSNSSI